MQTKTAATTLEQENKALREEVAGLKDQLNELQRLIFGAKSERFVGTAPDGQLDMFTTAAPEAKKPSPTEQVSYERQKPSKGKPVRALLPAHLPREEEVIEPEGLPEGAQKLGEEVTELLGYTPGRLHVRRVTRPKYTMPGSGISVAPMPIPKGNAGAGLLAHVQVSKATFNSWFNATCSLLESRYALLVDRLKAENYLQTDESPIKVLESDHDKATHQGYHWVYHAPLAKLAVFDYRPSRSREGPVGFLADFGGTLQTDGHTAYNELGKANRLTMLACMAHARRYFDKALDSAREGGLPCPEPDPAALHHREIGKGNDGR
jgi:hypothetical protein